MRAFPTALALLAFAVATPGGLAGARGADAAPYLYRLEPNTSFEVGCFDGCACPITILTPDALRLRHEPAADCGRYDSLRRAI